MAARDIPFSRTMFLTTVVVSWVLITGALIAVAWADRDHTLPRLAAWVSLWIFTVLVPTLHARALHRAWQTLAESSCPDNVLRDIAVVRIALLLAANMAALSAFALMFGR